MNPSDKKEVIGILHFWSETGTEGGYWALQDTDFILKIVPGWGFFPGQKIFDINDPEREGSVIEAWKRNKWWKFWKPYLSLPDPNSKYGISPNEIVLGLIKWDDGSVEKRKSNQILVINWSYDGLHVLKDGDMLTIYSKEDPNEIVWSGTIKLKRHPIFTEDADGMWIHADQEGIDRETWANWFFGEHPAKLIKADKPQK